MKTINRFLVVLLTIACTVLDGAGAGVPRPVNKRVLCLGDSITHGGHCLYYLQLMENLRHPGSTTRYYNAGHSGGTIADCINDDYAFEINRVNPDLVIAMFGMNDFGGAHYPDTWGEATDELKAEVAALDAAYRVNYTNLIASVRKLGVSDMILVTPSPYDEYSTGIYAQPRYWTDRLGLATAAESVRTIAAEKSLPYVELHTPMAAIIQAYPKPYGDSAVWGWCGDDRVHPWQLGHLFMATRYLKAYGETAPVACVSLRADGSVARSENATVSNVQKLGDQLTFDYEPKALPFPKLAEYELLKQVYPEIETVYNVETLRVSGLTGEGRWQVLANGRPLGIFTGAELSQGVNLAVLDTPNARIANEAAAVMRALHDFDVTLRDRRLDDIHAEHRATVFAPVELARQESYYQTMASVRPVCERIEIRPCWFDAKIQEYAAWPADATMAVGGAWTATALVSGTATLDDDGALGVEGMVTVAFDADSEKQIVPQVDALTVSSTIDAGVYPVDALPAVDPAAKGGILVATDGDGNFFYCGLVKSGDQNVWARLEGPAAPADGRAISVRMTLSAVADEVFVNYNIEGADYRYAGSTDIPVATTDLAVSSVDYGGMGSVYTLAAGSEVADPTELHVRQINKADDGKTPVSADVTYGATNFERQIYVCWGRDGGTAMADWTNCRQIGSVPANSVAMTAVFPEAIRSDMIRSGFRLFIGYTTAKDYVQDGLSVLYDCRENVGWNTFDASATVWRNLASENRDTDLVLNTDGGDCFRTDNVYFKSSVYPKQTTDPVASEQVLHTAEVNILSPGVNWHKKFLTIPGLGAVGFRCSGDSEGWLMVWYHDGDNLVGRIYDGFLRDDAYHTYVAKFGEPGYWPKAYLDGVEKSHVDADSVESIGTIENQYRLQLGFTDGERDLNLRSVRIYNRVLSQAEITRNRAVDVARFEGGVPFHATPSRYTKANHFGVIVSFK